MEFVWEGEIVRTRELEYDYLEIRNEEKIVMSKKPYLRIPVRYMQPHKKESNIEYKDTSLRNKNYPISINYIKKLRKTVYDGIFAYDEFHGLRISEYVIVHTDTYLVRIPFSIYIEKNRLYVLNHTDDLMEINTDKICIENKTHYDIFNSSQITIKTKKILLNFLIK